MFTKFINFFSSEEDKDPAFIRLTRNIVIFITIANFLLLPLVTGIIGNETARNPVAFTALSITFILELISLYLIYKGTILPAKIIIPIALLITVVITTTERNGLRNTGIIGLPLILILSAILLGKRFLVTITPLAVISLAYISYIDLSDKIKLTRAGIDDAFLVTILVLSSAAIINLLITRLNENIEKARASEEIQKKENAELNELRANLEERVNQRTADLVTANHINGKRARQFQAVTEVTKVISSIQSLELLLPRITEVISQQFHVYHTGIFLLDARREYAVLRAANSSGGKKMVERGHRLLVGQTGIVGFVTATGQPRIALDVEADAAFFNNPDLPNTRSEISLPLHYSNELIGALDVQSLEANAFDKDDIEVLVTLADQVAVAIKNVISIEEAQKALSEAQSAILKSTLETWQILKPKKMQLGMTISESTIKALETPLEGSHIQDALDKGETILANDVDKKQKIAIPIRLRGKVVGVVHISTRDTLSLTEDDIDVAEAIAERLSLAIESATLLQAVNYRADIERITGDITSRISSSTRIESILQTTAKELSRALGGSDVLVQIEPAALELSIGNE